jgi:signal transduction histidine kinase
MLDHQMPGCTGMEILEKLVSDKSDTLAIMVTAYASLEMAVKATKQGAYDFLAKPFTPGDLRKVVEKAARHMLSVKAAKRLASERHRVRFEFLSVLAHELKAPLGAVEGYLRLIEEGVTKDNPEAQARVVDRCLVRLEGMRKLIFDLLDLTRIESGQKQREVHPVDLAELLPRIMETFAPEADVRNIAMELEVTGDTTMQGDPGELEIILNNLVSNAVKYNRDGGRVTVDVRGDDEMLMIQVTDTGIGMTEEEAASLFGEFVRIKNEKTKTILGSGLGLSIVRRLARLNGGDVTVQSEDNVGSTFTVTLARTGVSDHHHTDAGMPAPQES